MTDLGTELRHARNILLAAPSMSGDESGVCTSLVVPDEPAQASVLWISFRDDARSCVEQWENQTAAKPRNAAVIVVGEASDGAEIEGIEVEAISTPSDLTGLGIRIGNFLSSWDGQPIVCFDSLTAMLQYVNVETAYEFLHAITGQFYAADATAHFHIDPTAHDRATVDAITSLFDAVVELGGPEPEIRKRQLLR